MLFLSLAWAAPIPATLTAEVHPGGRTITGVLELPPGIEVVSPYPLPGPADDLNQLRTFPGRIEQGSLSFTETEPGRWEFETVLPRRFGAIGATPWHGTYALGGFYPQPMQHGRLADLDWTVTVTLPSGRTGVVGDTVGQGTLLWEGRGERVALAIPRKAQVEQVEVGDHLVTIVGKGRPRRALLRAVERILPDPGGDVVLVEGPLRRRLMRPARGTVFVSDRIFRMFPHFSTYHRRSFVEGVSAAATPSSDPLTRQLVGSVVASQWAEARRGNGATGFTRAFTWVPQIDYLLSSRRMAFYSEVFEEVHSSDPVRDDLAEVLAPSLSGSAVHRQLDDRWGPGTAHTVVEGVRLGLALEQALQFAGTDPLEATHWRSPPRLQDYRLVVGAEATITRHTERIAPAETLVIRVDGEPRSIRLSPGESFTLDRPHSVWIDPQRHLAQTSRRADGWPQRRFRLVTSAWIDTINLTQFRISGSAAAWLRGRNDTRNVFSGSAFSSRSTLVGARLGWSHKFGPLIDGISRQQRLSFRVGPNLIDPSFLAEEDGPVSIVGRVSWSWDTRVSSNFPLRGRRYSLGVSGGTFPGTESRWIGTSGSVTGVASPHPRHAFAGRVSAGLARSTRTDQLITLGGLGLMRSLPVLPPCQLDSTDPCAPVATEYAFAAGEYRVAPLRNINVPLGLAWWTELQLTAGVEAVVANLETGAGQAYGATLGIAGVGDLLGAQPNMIGFTGGWSVWRSGVDYGSLTPVPEVYLRWGQAF